MPSLLRTRHRLSKPGLHKLDDQQLAALGEAIQGIIEAWARPYQINWLADDSPRKLGLWCRQSGKGRTLTLEVPILSMTRQLAPDHVQTLVSSSGPKSMELLERVRHWTDAIDTTMRNMAGVSIYAAEPTKHEIRLNPMGHIISYASNAATLAGNTGDVWVDEFSKIPRDDKVYEAVAAIPTTRDGYVFRVTGTPWGDEGVFYDLVHGCGVAEVAAKSDDPKMRWSIHRIDLPTAIKYGDTRNYEMVRSGYDPKMFAQDYLLEFQGGNESVFNRKLLMECRALFDRQKDPWAGRQDRNRDWRVCVGVDPGESGDRTAFVWIMEFPQDRYRVFKVERYNSKDLPLPQVEAMIKAILDSGRADKVEIDSTGIGAQMSQSLRMQYPSRVHGIKYTADRKSKMVQGFLEKATRGWISICDDADFLDDMRSIRMRYLPISKVLQYYSPRNEDGHADAAWACLQAFAGLAMGYETRTAVITDDPSVAAGIRSQGGAPASMRPGSSFLTPMPGRERDRAPTVADLGGLSITEEVFRTLSDEQKRLLGILT